MREQEKYTEEELIKLFEQFVKMVSEKKKTKKAS